MFYKFQIFFYLWYVSQTGQIFSQSVSESEKIADSLFLIKDYQKSLEIYQRVLFFVSEKSEIQKKLADLYFEWKMYGKALAYYDSAIIQRNNPDYNKIVFKKADCYIFLGQYASAFQSIKQLNPENSELFIQRVNFYKGIISFSEEQFEDAEVFFLNTLSDTAIQSKEMIKTLFAKKSKFRSPKPIIAGLMSLIVPGAGQFYTGHLNSGINSIVLLSILSIIAVDMGIRFSFYDPLITILPWFIRYYEGGYLNSRELATEKLNRNRTQTLNEILEIIHKAHE
jgi:tetratricopeptide (TPR) repeat protein